MSDNSYWSPYTFYGTQTGRIRSLPTVGSIKSDIRYLIEKWDREYCKEIGFYLASRHLPYTKRFILAKAVEEFTKRYPDTNGLLLLEAMDELKKEMDRRGRGKKYENI